MCIRDSLLSEESADILPLLTFRAFFDFWKNGIPASSESGANGTSDVEDVWLSFSERLVSLLISLN